MATKHDTRLHWGILASMLLALIIGSDPAATMIALSAQMEALQ